MMDWHGGATAWGWIFMTVFWVALLVLIVWLAARLFPTRDGRGDGELERPEELLDRRLARGEIDPETYDALREKLRVARAERR